MTHVAKQVCLLPHMRHDEPARWGAGRKALVVLLLLLLGNKVITHLLPPSLQWLKVETPVQSHEVPPGGREVNQALLRVKGVRRMYANESGALAGGSCCGAGVTPACLF